MKSLIAGVLGALTLAGCVAVPYYAEPAPAPGYYYSPYYYPAPPVSFSFQYHQFRRR